MSYEIKNKLFIGLGWIFIGLGVIGVVLPIVPTTPFLIVALALFSKSSSRFHRMLLSNPWVGPVLRQWESNKTLSRPIKYRATALIVITFAVSIAILHGKLYLQCMLVGLASILLFFIWRIREKP